MKNRLLIMALTALLVAGCRESEPVQALEPAVLEQGDPQPKLPTIQVYVGSEVLETEIARTTKQQRLGMMFRTEMAENEAMLFVFPYPHQAGFYMKNTLIPLSCAYVDGSGKILEIYDMKPRDEKPIYAKSDQIQFVLEVRQGWFERRQIKPGMVIRTEKGTLQETFFGGE